MSKFARALEKIQNESNGPEKDEVAARKKDSVFEAAANAFAENDAVESLVPVLNLQPDMQVVLQRFPNSYIAEQYRMLRTALKSRLHKQSGNVILISSAVHGEGKTLTAANLAVALAENGHAKVAIVDGDLRQGRLAEYMGFGADRQGLSHFLSNGLAIHQVMVRNFMENLTVIPRGAFVQKPAELVSCHKFQDMIRDLRKSFDYILIDTPPILTAADAGILGKEADGVLMVIRMGTTSKNLIAHSSFLFKQAGVNLLGYVLTHVDSRSSDFHQYSCEQANYRDGQKDGTSNYRLRKAGWRLKNMEEKFDQWWNKKILKNKAGQSQTSETSEEAKQAALVVDISNRRFEEGPGEASEKKKKSRKVKILLISVIVTIVLAGAAFWYLDYTSVDMDTAVSRAQSFLSSVWHGAHDKAMHFWEHLGAAVQHGVARIKSHLP